MSFIQNFFTSRDNQTDGNTYVGQEGRLWYNPDTNSIYVNAANIAGGTPVALATGANITANNLTVNSITSTSGNVNVTGNIVISGNISPAAVGKIGGITPGPGANISANGLLTIDTAGLPLSFGDFTANNNILTLVNVDQNMVLATQGSAEVQLVGNIGFYKSDGLPPNVVNRFFQATDDGQITILVPAEDPIAGGVEIIGSSTGNFITPGQPGTMLHLTGNPNVVTRVYIDGNAEYSSIVGRRFNGNVAVPTQVLAGQDVLRINATAATDAGVGNIAFAQIHMSALENQTTTAQGSEISLIVTPVGQSAANRVEVANVTVANGIRATQFNTSGNISATGNITGGNVLTAGVISAIGNVTGTNIISAGGGYVSAVGNIYGGNLIMTTGGIEASSGLISTTANISGGNILTGGLISALGNIAGGNVNAYFVNGNSINGVLISATGDITGGNILTVGSISATGNITTAGTFVGNLSGLHTRPVRNAGTIADGGTLTIDFSANDLVYCVWNNGMTIAANNFTAGRVVRVMATKGPGSGTDSITLSGFTASHTSTGTLTQAYGADVTAIIEFISTTTAVGGVYIKF